MPRRTKKTSTRRSPTAPKSPVLAPAPTPVQRAVLGKPTVGGRHFVWRLSRADHGGPFSLKAISDKDLRAVWKRMREFEQKTIEELRQMGSHHNPILEILAPDAQKRIRQLRLDDVTELHSFRITGQKRLWCIKLENVYALLWWDPEHQVYPVPQ